MRVPFPVRGRIRVLSISLLLLFVSCSGSDADPAPAVTLPERPSAAALESITAEDLHRHISKLASDEFEGRAPASKGEELTLAYLEEQFKRVGAIGGAGGDGSYRQKVPLVGITLASSPTLTVLGRNSLRLDYGRDFMAWTKRVEEEVSLDAEMVFVGYGTVAPEFGWDDYKDVDVKGKVLVMLVNDPPLADEKMFGGKAMTYYGRWTYKFEIAAEKGAAGCFVIHETGRAGYPWSVVSGSWGGEQFDLMTPDKNAGRIAVEGWLQYATAKTVFGMTGKNLDQLKEQAATAEFRPVPLGLKATMTLRNKIRTLDSHNVIATISGSDPILKDQYVAYSGHWDHLGIGNAVGGDKIYNGARDNGTGTGALIELAEAFSKLETKPRRSILFLAVTAEESGLLGSKHYATNPVYPLVKTAGVINMDAMNPWGRTKDITIIGMGTSTLDSALQAAAQAQNRTLKPDPEPEKGFFYRSDHFEFAKEGVPAAFVESGVEYIGKPEGWGIARREQYTAEDYHKPSDEVKEDWDLRGLADDVRLMFEAGYRVANQDALPTWNPGTEFKAKREAMMKEEAASDGAK